MKKLLNVLYVVRPDAYLALENESVLIKENTEIVLRVPLHNLQGIVHFGYTGASPALMAECAKRNIALTFLTENGKFLATIIGESKGNVVLRKEQYRISDSEERSALVARNFIFGKLHNAKWGLERAVRDHFEVVDVAALKEASAQISSAMRETLRCDNLEILRAIEGNAAQGYFRVFNELILKNKDYFIFVNRNKRPPTDAVNALLSFAYVLLAADCRNALEVVGLDAYVGFLHRDRPGRASLALDIMEELRCVFADRFVLSLINRGEVNASHFLVSESGAVTLSDDARKSFLNSWQNKKREVITHPYIQEKIEWGLVPHVQALLLARMIRGDLEEYPPFLWK
ncbi:MAG TPA: type I-C CRISPR-associated endonuclease Cas1c [Eubacteriales bacterium]|nr:type I-C CRISPR-associated endonuclease Cas1c [Eubacteriales bacterium]HRU84689.1 type I-C CRISPR-associated endonuclease Cas1c [Eubacteriales bacterium]